MKGLLLCSTRCTTCGADDMHTEIEITITDDTVVSWECHECAATVERVGTDEDIRVLGERSGVRRVYTDAYMADAFGHASSQGEQVDDDQIESMRSAGLVRMGIMAGIWWVTMRMAADYGEFFAWLIRHYH